MAGGSETILASIEKTKGFSIEYFGKPIDGCHNLHAEVVKIRPVGGSGEWYHVPSSDIPVDRNSQLDNQPGNLGLDSKWQTGLVYLSIRGRTGNKQVLSWSPTTSVMMSRTRVKVFIPGYGKPEETSYSTQKSNRCVKYTESNPYHYLP